MRLLLVEDSRTAVKMVEGLLAEEEEKRDIRFDLSIAGSLGEAEAALSYGAFDLILLDLTLPDSHGLHTVEAIVEVAPRTPVVVLTSTADEQLGLQALKRGAQDFLVKDETYRKVLVRSVRYAYLRNEAEREVREARDMAEFATNSKSSFIANLSHELRTPLNAIMGFSDIMRSRLFGPLPDRYGEYAELIHESGRHLLDLINDVLDMSKIEAERFELSREAFDGREAVNAVLRLMRGQADRAGVQLRGVLPREPLEIDADRRALKQIALNLVSNALKFTPRNGAVTVGLQAVGGMMELVVADTGMGMSPEDLARVGRPYEQAGDAERRAAGTGLGLSLVRSFAELHGGEMILESAVGEGTTVTVRLPVLLPPYARPEGDAPAPSEPVEAPVA